MQGRGRPGETPGKKAEKPEKRRKKTEKNGKKQRSRRVWPAFGKARALSRESGRRKSEKGQKAKGEGQRRFFKELSL
jgi:hypothetical protein